MAKQTTVKPIALGYRAIGNTLSAYTPLMGVLKGLAIGQDEPDATEIESEFYDSPFDIYYDGNPVTMTFELTNYDLEELPDLFGGYIDDDATTDDYESETTAYTSEWEWKLDFGRGFKSLIIPKGLTIGTIKKDADGALNFSITITSLTTKYALSANPDNDIMYVIRDADAPDLPMISRVQVGDYTQSLPASGEMTVSIDAMSMGSDIYLYGESLDGITWVLQRDITDPLSKEIGDVHEEHVMFEGGVEPSANDEWYIFRGSGANAVQVLKITFVS